MAQSVVISRRDIHDFLARKGFQPITLPGTREAVYGKIVCKRGGLPLCLRVYTSVEGDQTRDNGKDAIRCVLVTRIDNGTKEGEVKIVGSDRRVHRVVGWRANLEQRLDNWQEMVGPDCDKCGAMTVRRKSRRGPFWGCCRYPACRSILSIQESGRPAPQRRSFHPNPSPAPQRQPDDEFYGDHHAGDEGESDEFERYREFEEACIDRD